MNKQNSQRNTRRWTALVALLAAGTIGGSAIWESALAGPPGMTAKKQDQPKKESEQKDDTKMPALQFKMKDIDGKEQDLAQYYGNVVLVVNVATYCGYTPQYKGLEAMYRKYKDKGFVVIGVPANEFGKQEPGTDAEIKEFCTKKFDVTFPMMSKVVVKGEGICPLYKYLTSKDAGHKFGGEIPWNFNKFLIDRTGHVAARFEHRASPDSSQMVEAVEKELKSKIPADSPLAAKKKAAKNKKTEE